MRAAFFRIVFSLLRALRPKPPEGPRTILVLQYAMPLGCCVHGTPLFAALRAQHPDAQLVVATRGTGAATLRHDPHIDHVIETADPLASARTLWSVASELRRKLRALHLRPGIILVDASSRSGSHALFAALLRLAPTTGFGNATLYDHALIYEPAQSLIDNNLRLAAMTGEPSPHREPAVYFTAADLARAQDLLRECNPQARPVTAFVMQGSGGQLTGWHDDRFAAVIRYITAAGHQALYLGTAADAAAIARIDSAAGRVGASLAGKTSIPQLAALLCLCDLVVTLDTGTLHVARASGVPLVVLGPCWQKPIEWLPVDLPTARILRGADCQGIPPDYRLDEISVEDVITTCNDLLRLYPPDGAQRTRRAAARLSETRT